MTHPMAAEAHPEPFAEHPWRRSFWSLIATQFQGGFNELAFKNLVVFLILAGGLSQQDRDQLVWIVTLLQAVPFILFSMAGGYFADRFSKRAVTVATKFLGVVVALLGLAGLALGNLPLQLVAVFLMGTQGALFGPSKYGLLPELLPPKRLSWGNGILELGTFLAIIGGTACGAVLSEVFQGRQYWSGFLFVGLAVVGLVASLGIHRVPPADVGKSFRLNFLADLYTQIRRIRSDRTLWLAVVGNTYFFALGTLLLTNIFIYGQDVLHVSAIRNSYLQAALIVGIALGSVAAGYLSKSKIEYGLIPLGAMGMTAFSAALALEGLSFRAVLVLLGFLGFSAGFFVVPVLSLIQHRPRAEEKGGVIAAANLLSFVGVGLGAGLYALLTTFAPKVLGTETSLSAPAIFLIAAGITLAGTVYVVVLLPDSLLRLLFWLATNTLYRIRIEGRDNIPEKGGALFACNHMSMVDAMLLIASTDRFIRFLMFQDSYEHPLVKPFARILRVIPISSQLRPRDLIHSLREATQSIQDGEVVGIFPEGQMTRIGQMLPFRRGMERIMKGVDAPIIPVHLDGVWGSIFSFERGRFLWKMPRRIPYPVTVTFGKPMPSTTTALEVRRVIQEMGSQAFHNRARQMRPLHRSFVRNAHRVPLRLALADGRTPRVSFGAALVRTIFLARRLRKTWQGQEMVGLLLPPSVGGALVNLAATLLGKVPVNLNYTVSAETLASCARQCNLQSIVSSRAFLEHIKLQLPMEPVLLEDLVAKPGFGEKLISFFMAWLPSPVLERALGRERPGKLDDLATIIFSSGSTGDPKGVMLTHYNVAANIEQVGQVFALDSEDRLLGILPFFHSFGFMGTLWLPLKLGLGVVYHPSPLDARVIGGLVGKYAVTFLLATPTFLQAYMRRCSPEDFGSLQFVLAGAEKLPERVALGFEDVFGIRPLEGYGCTECSPVVAVNTRDFRAPGFRQVGAKRGRIGHPLPGVSVRIVDPETGQPLGLDQPGLLWVSGPNIMQGYLGQPEKTAEVLRDGWYNTGDIATVDEDGFLRVTDRLSRFSKIGGEMVPHLMIEEKLQELAGVVEQVFAVTSIPDERKGERLAVLHTLPEGKLQEVLAKLAESDLPALWKPRPQQFFRVETLPYLGTGKLDLRRMREVALAAGGPPEAAADQP